MGIQQMLLSGDNLSTGNVTVGQSSTTFGWSDGSQVAAFGSFSGSSNFVKSGGRATSYSSTAAVADFQLVNDGLYAGSATGAFTNVAVTNHLGSIVNFTSAAATYHNTTQPFFWTWGTGTTPVWSVTNDVRAVTIT